MQLKPLWPKAVLMFTLVLVNITLELIPPLLLSRFIDQATAGVRLAFLQGTAYAYIAITFGRQFVLAAVGYLSADIGWRATNRLRLILIEHCLNLDMPFHLSHGPGELIERVDGDVSMIAQFFSEFVFDIFGRIMLGVGILALTYWVDWRIGLLLTCFGALSILVLRRLRGVAVPHYKSLRQSNADLSAFFEEHVGFTEEIRASGARRYVMSKLEARLDRFQVATRRSSVSGRYYSSSLEVSVAAAGASVILLGAALLQHHSITFGNVYLSFTYMNMLAMTLGMITRQMNQFQAARAGLTRIGELLTTRSTVADGRDVLQEAGAPRIEFDDVTFSYSVGRDVLSGVSFLIEPGESLGLVGHSGSGKTTISRLLFRGCDPVGGTVRINGTDVRRLKLDDLRARIGVVTQDVQIFHGTLRDNLTLFDQGVADQQLEEAIDYLGLTPWYRSLQSGLDAMIGSSAMSAGESQLLAFIRVLLRQPDIVILDEASSRLDPSTERYLSSAITRLLAGRTGVVIAHRLATLDQVDRVLVMEEGRVVECGRRAELADSPESRFSSLLAKARS
jgi:ATP-binding cassette subfamily B protein